MSQPAPFEISDHEGGRTATNGKISLTLTEVDGLLFKRRAIKGINIKPVGELALPLLNGLATELLGTMDMSTAEFVQRLSEITAQVQPQEPQNVEWAVAHLGDVYVYVDNDNVIVTRKDIRP